MTGDGSSVVQYLPTRMPMTLAQSQYEVKTGEERSGGKLCVSVLRVEPRSLHTLGFTMYLAKRLEKRKRQHLSNGTMPVKAQRSELGVWLSW